MTDTKTPGDALLVRVDANDPAWMHLLPSTPPSVRVTVTVSDVSLLDAAPVLAGRGYEVVAVVADPLGVASRCAHVLVPRGVAETWPGWWAAVTATAERVYATALGPVARLFGVLVRIHVEAAQPAPTTGG